MARGPSLACEAECSAGSATNVTISLMLSLFCWLFFVLLFDKCSGSQMTKVTGYI